MSENVRECRDASAETKGVWWTMPALLVLVRLKKTCIYASKLASTQLHLRKFCLVAKKSGLLPGFEKWIWAEKMAYFQGFWAFCPLSHFFTNNT
jgi:hypothetical protein